MQQILHKKIDQQGRVLLPREWRESTHAHKVIIVMNDESLKIFPESKKLSSFFEKAKASSLATDPFKDYEQFLAEASLR